VLGRTDETPQGPARRAGRPASGPRRGQVRRRDAAALPAVIVFLALGVSLLTIVLAQAVLGLDWFGSSSPPERPALLASPTARPAAGPAAPRLPLEPQGAETLGATPPGAKPFVNDPALAALVQQHLGGLRGLFGVAIKDLDSGRGVLINADREFPAASLFKLPVMYEVYRQRDAGRLSLADSLTLTAHYAQYDLGTLDVPVGSTVSVGWALERMITRSDNSTANLLLDRVGVANVNDTMRELGLRETRISGDKLTTSPRDMLLLLELLATGRGPSPNSSTEMVQLLLEQRVNDRLPAQLPRDTPVAHKTGNLDGVVHDVGIVYSPAATFVIALLAAEVPDVGQVSQAEAALARAVYDYFNPPGERARSAFRAPSGAARPTAVPPRLASDGQATPTAGAASPAPAVGGTPVLRATADVEAVATPGRAAAPTVAPTRAITAVRPTATPTTTAAAPNGAAGEATPAATAVRPTAAPTTPAVPGMVPTEPARGPLPPTAAPTSPPPASTPAPTVPASPAGAAATPPVRLPEAPRFGQATPAVP